MSEHAPLAPSSAERWVNCPGSVKLEALYPEAEEAEHQREGNAAHWAAQEVGEGRLVAPGQIAPNGWVLDDDACDGADLMLSAIPERLRPFVLRESRVSMARRIHPDNWGTPDAWAYDAHERVVYVWDYKFGHGVVDVFENWQLVNYAAGVVEHLGLDGGAELEHRVVLCIVQPRAYHRDGHVRRWTVPMAHLRNQWNRLEMAAATAVGDSPPVNPGPYCDNCRARHECPGLHKDTSRIWLRFENAVPLVLSDNALGHEIRDLRRLQTLLEARVSGLEAAAEQRLRGGRRIPGLALDSKPGREKWTADSATVIAFGQMYGLQLSKPPEPITPNQARKAGLPEEVLKGMAARERTAPKLTLSDESDARRIFGS